MNNITILIAFPETIIGHRHTILSTKNNIPVCIIDILREAVELIRNKKHI